jgi:hypothetical protein
VCRVSLYRYLYVESLFKKLAIVSKSGKLLFWYEDEQPKLLGPMDRAM